MTLLQKGSQSTSVAFSKESEEDRGVGRFTVIKREREMEGESFRNALIVSVGNLEAG